MDSAIIVKCPACHVKFTINPRRRQTHSNLLHKLVATWATEMGESAAHAKIVFKYAYGVWVPFPFEGPVPDWPGQFAVMYEGTQSEVTVYMKSESAYDKDEEQALVEGTKAECFDAGIDLEWLKDGDS